MCDLVWPSPSGTHYPAGGVPSGDGCRDGGEAAAAVVGGLADAGPCAAQPGRSGPGKCGRGDRGKEKAEARSL